MSSVFSWMRRTRYVCQTEHMPGFFSSQHAPVPLCVQEIVRCMGWTLLPPLIQLLLKKEDKNLPQWLAIFTHLLEVSEAPAICFKAAAPAHFQHGYKTQTQTQTDLLSDSSKNEIELRI